MATPHEAILGKRSATEINHCAQPMGFDPGMLHNPQVPLLQVTGGTVNKCGTPALRRGYSQNATG